MKNNYLDNIIQVDSVKSWLVCFAAAVMVGLSLGVTYSFGVLFVSLLVEFKESRSKTAWISSLHFLWYMLLSPLTSYLAQMYGHRRVAFVGSLFFVVGIFSSTFVQNLELFYFTYGILFATGTSILLVSGITVVPFLFQKHIGTATGIVTGSIAFSSPWISPLYEYLIRTFGWRHASKLLCLLVVPLTISCSLLPNKQQLPMEAQKSAVGVFCYVKRLLQCKRFLLWLFLMCLVYLGLMVPYVHLFSLSEDMGISSNIGVYTLSVLPFFDFLGRITAGNLLDRFGWNAITFNSFVILAMAVSNTLLPLATHVSHLFLYSAVYGFTTGMQCLLALIITPTLRKEEDTTHDMTFYYCFLSLPGALGPVLAGWVYDTSKSYHLSFFISGGLFAAAALFSVLLSTIPQRCDSRRCWLACFGAATLTGLSIGVSYSFGVLYVSLLREFNEDRSKTAWVGSLHFLWYMLLSPLTSYLAHMYGHRRVAFVGSFVFVFGIFSSTFVQNLELFYFTYGILFATGTSILLVSGITVVPFLFQKHIGTATGIMIASTSFCSLWVAPLYEYLIRTFGWRHAGKLLCLVIVPLTIGSASLPNKQQLPRTISQDTETGMTSSIAVYVKGLMKSKRFLFWLIVTFVVHLGLFIPHTHLFSFSEDIGIPTRISVYTISVMCLCDCLGKVIVGKLQDCFVWDLHTTVIYVFLVLAVSNSLLPLAKHVSHVFLYSVFYGFSTGVLALVGLTLTPKLCQGEYGKHSVSILYCVIAFPGAFGPVFAGWIYDMKKSYHLAFFISGGAFAFSALLAIILSSMTEKTEVESRNGTKEQISLEMNDKSGMETEQWVLNDLKGDAV